MWTNLAWKSDATPEDPPTNLWVEQARAGNRLMIESAELVDRADVRDCTLDPHLPPTLEDR